MAQLTTPLLQPPESKVTKSFVENLIHAKSPRITFQKKVEKSRALSSVWSTFSIVVVDGTPVDFVCCDQCFTVYVYNSWNTSTMSKHKCSSAANKGTGRQLTLEEAQQIREKKKKLKPVPSTAVSDLNEVIAAGLAKDLKPLGTVDGLGFLEIAQKLVEFGHEYGPHEIKKYIHHSTTLQRSLPSLVSRTREELKKEILMAPSFPKLAFTTDMWSDQYKQRSFLSLSTHYISKDNELITNMLAVDEFPDKQKSTDNIRAECHRIIGEYFPEHVDKIIEQSVAITDGGSNFIKIFPNRLPCMCHKNNLVVHAMLNETKPKAPKNPTTVAKTLPERKTFVLSEACPTYSAVMSNVKSLVTFFKQSGLNSKLENTLKQDVENRWNSTLIMLESYQKSSSQVKTLLLERNQLEKVVAINDGAVNELISFLKEFRDCTNEWSADKRPTLPSVVVRAEKLRSHVIIKNGDSEEMQRLKRQALLCIDEYFKLDDLHYIATMLHPAHKKLRKYANKDTRRRLKEMLIRFVDSEVEKAKVSVSEATCEEPAAKRARTETEESQGDSSSDDDEISIGTSEVEQYLRTAVLESDSKDFDLLKYWSSATQFPNLQKVALGILQIPASQTSDERVFSSTGNTLSPRRTELKGSTLSNLTFLHKNYQFKKPESSENVVIVQ